MFRFIPPATRILILANVVVYLLQRLWGDGILGLFALWPVGTRAFEPWQVLSYAFLHDPQNILHVAFNMFALYMFGSPLEVHWGRQRYVNYYAASVLAAAFTELAVEALSHTGEPVIGASGAVFGLLLGFAWFFPRQRVMLLFPPIPMPAWLFVTLYGAVELVLGVTGTQTGVAHFAHLGGMLGGALMILLWQARDKDRFRRN